VRYLKLNQSGDTIVEVLIAMVILAFVLTGAYESAQYSLNNIINAENRISALNIATSQIESLKKIIATTSDLQKYPIFNNGTFYINSSDNYIQVSKPVTQVEGGNFYYEFAQPTKEYYAGTTTVIDYTFTINVYWRNLTFNSTNSKCSVNATSYCDVLDLSYQASV
jgi:prepilin-type N-terminal cleavage/methylation domain-containing protein